jgi:hypothetical protein
LDYWLTVKGTVGFVTNFGYGAIEGYAGGKGNIGTVLQSAALNGAAGIVTTPVGEIFSDTLTNGADYFFGKGRSYEVVDQNNEVNQRLGTYSSSNWAGATDTLSEIYGDRLIERAIYHRRINIP